MDPLRNIFWGKLERDENKRVLNWHTLLNHSLDVSMVMQELLHHTVMGRRVAAVLGKQQLDRVEIARLCALSMLHDAGKANSGFQAQALDPSHIRIGHVKPMIQVLQDPTLHERVLQPLGVVGMLEWFDEQTALVDMLTATWCHHGNPVAPSFVQDPAIWEPNGGPDPQKGLLQLAELIREVFREAFMDHAPFGGRHLPRFQHLYNGLLTLSDWIGSDTRFFPFEPEEYQEPGVSKKRAQVAVNTLGLNASRYRKWMATRSIGFELISPFTPYDLQRRCQDLPNAVVHGSLTIMESETGSGKTEAALMRFIMLYLHGHVDGLYFALPTRAAATQLHERVVETVKRAFPESHIRPTVIQGVSGYIKVDDVEGTPLPDFKVTWPDDKADFVAERAWAGESPKRYLAGAITVGTIDQVLLAGLQARHAHMRAGALTKNLLVVDEVHASDHYMTRLLHNILDFHLSTGGHALLMSATLGSVARERYLNGWAAAIPELNEAVQMPYPIISERQQDSGHIQRTTVESTVPVKRVAIDAKPIADEPSWIADIAYKAASNGAKVLVIRNLVNDCIQTQLAVEARVSDLHILFDINGTPTPHHSRFSPTDRVLLDQAIERRFGKRSATSACIAVTTQTVEQSLDIDADLLITDLCPIDVLLQRIGRLHRHAKQRTNGFEEPRCIVLMPADRILDSFINEQGSGRRGPHGLGTVYEDLRVLEATWRLIENRPEWVIPFDNRWLVENGTHPDVLDEITTTGGDKWKRHEQYLMGQRFAEHQIADLSTINFDTPFGDLRFNELSQRLRTRLGRDDLKVLFAPSFTGPFGSAVSSLSLRPPDGLTIEEPPILGPEHLHISHGEARFDLFGRSYRYTRHGLERI